MMALWNTHFLISSVTLGVVTALTIYLGRALLSRRPTIYHGFLVFILMAFLITLPLQFGTAYLQNSHNEDPEPLKKSTGPLIQEGVDTVGENIIPFEGFLGSEGYNALFEAHSPESFFAENPGTDVASSWLADPQSNFDDESFANWAEETEHADMVSSSLDFGDNQNQDLELSPEESSATLAALLNEGRKQTTLERMSDSLAPHVDAPWLIYLHLFGVAILSVIELLRLRKTKKITNTAIPVTDELTLKVWREVAGSASERIQLCQSPLVHAPVCWGVFKPMIIVPNLVIRNGNKTPFKWALRHELVHLRRGDPRTTLFQSALRILFWFHPATWFFNSELNRMREISCDHTVVGSQGSRKSYALALLEYAEQKNKTSRLPTLSPTAPALIPWSGSMSQLERRIKMLAQSERNTIRPLRLVQVLGAAFAAVCLFGSQVALAAHMPIPQSTDAAPMATEIDATTTDTLSPPTPELPPNATVDFTLPQDRTRKTIDLTKAPRPMDATVKNIKSWEKAKTKFEIGVILKSFDSKLAENLGMPKGTGLVITKIIKNSHAERSGLKVNDPIVKIDGEYASMKQIRAAKKRSGGKTPIKFLVMRGASIKTIVVRFNHKKRVKVAPRQLVEIFEDEDPEEIAELEVVEEQPASRARARRTRTRGSVARAPRPPRTPRTRSTRRPPYPTVRPNTSRPSNVDRQIMILNQRIDRLTKTMERQALLIERLMKRNDSKHANPRYPKSSHQHKSTGKIERSTLATELAERHALLEKRAQEMAKASRELNRVEALLTDLSTRDALVSQRALELKRVEEVLGKKKALSASKELLEALESRLLKIDRTLKKQSEERERLSALKNAQIAEYEARLNALESASTELKDRARAKKSQKGKRTN